MKKRDKRPLYEEPRVSRLDEKDSAFGEDCTDGSGDSEDCGSGSFAVAACSDGLYFKEEPT